MPLSYSRRLLWLTVGVSNNDPRVIAFYYLKCVKELGGKSHPDGYIYIKLSNRFSKIAKM